MNRKCDITAGTILTRHNMTVMTDLALDSQTEQQLTELSNSTGKTPAEIIREALQAYVADLDDVRMATEVLDRIESGQERTITLDELEHQLDLDR